MTKRCVVCGEEFEPKRAVQKTCGDPDCVAVHKAEYIRLYLQRQRTEHREERNEYHRTKMREYREKYGYGYGQQKYQTQTPKEDTMVAEGYSDRQKQKTLEMVGRVEI